MAVNAIAAETIDYRDACQRSRRHFSHSSCHGGHARDLNALGADRRSARESDIAACDIACYGNATLHIVQGDDSQ
jgi:hypothetical protein